MQSRSRVWIITGGVLWTAIGCGGCAPTAQEWAEAAALPEGPAKTARTAELETRAADEERWWELAGWAGSLAGGLVPGAGLAVAALHRARRAQRECDGHAAAAKTLTGNVAQALAQLSTEQRRTAVEQIKQSQVASGQRDLIRAYLRPTAASTVAAAGAGAESEARA